MARTQRRLTVDGYLSWLSRSVVRLSGLAALRHDPLSTVWTSVVLFQPSTHTFPMKPMAAGQDCDFIANDHVVHAD